MTPLPTFTAAVVSGAGRGRRIGTPTINLDLTDVPATLQDGIYACRVDLPGIGQAPAALHLGPRPVFKDDRSCEVYLIDRTIDQAPASLQITVVAYLREVRDFPSSEALVAQIRADVIQTRGILGLTA